MSPNEKTLIEIEDKLTATQKLCTDLIGNHPMLIHLLFNQFSYFFLSSCARSMIGKDKSAENRIFFNDLTDFLAKLEKDFIVNEHIKQKKLKNDILSIGSPGKFSDKVLSFSATSKDITLYECLHGSECGAVDLPSWRYDDYSSC